MNRADIVTLDKRHIWRPYTSSKDHQELDPLVIAAADGVWLTDVDGRRYLDANGSWWVNLIGHRHPRLKHALERQASQLMHCALAGITHEPAARLAEALAQVAPKNLTRTFFSDDGSTAVEVALKMAFQYWQQNGHPQRRRFVTLTGAFHGDTVGAMSIGGVTAFRDTFGPLLFDVFHAPEPNASWDTTFSALFDFLQHHAEQVAGVIVEPLIQGAAGMRIWPAHHLRTLRAITHQLDVWLIADEVFTGFGRTGRMWACDHAEVSPDFLCLAKGLSGGVLPLGATMTTERVYDGFRGGKERALMHGHSFCGNPLGTAIAHEVLSIYRDERIIEQLPPKIAQIGQAFERFSAKPLVHRTRALGMVAAADLGDGGYLGHVGWRVYQAALRNGAYLRPLGDTLYICPPLTISESELATLLQIVESAIDEAHALA